MSKSKGSSKSGRRSTGREHREWRSPGLHDLVNGGRKPTRGGGRH